MMVSNKPSQPSDTPGAAADGPSASALAVIDVGNRSISLGLWDRMQVGDTVRTPTSDREGFASALAGLCSRFADGQPSAVVAISVVPQAADWLRSLVAEVAGRKLEMVGPDIDLPCPVDVREPAKVGVDRVCAAAAAYELTGHACTVVDFGTAITVDLIDDAGRFAGGAILPGAEMQAQALARGTAALPQVEPTPPEDAIGRDTSEAIRSGICNGIPGAVRGIVEQYATKLKQWPQVVATGGDLELFLDRCDFIDSPVPELTLIGVGLAHSKHGQPAGQ